MHFCCFSLANSEPIQPACIFVSKKRKRKSEILQTPFQPQPRDAPWFPLRRWHVVQFSLPDPTRPSKNEPTASISHKKKGKKRKFARFFPLPFLCGERDAFLRRWHIRCRKGGKGRRISSKKKLDAFLSYGGKVCTYVRCYDCPTSPFSTRHEFTLFFRLRRRQTFSRKSRASSKNRNVILPHFSLKLKPLPSMSLIGIFFLPSWIQYNGTRCT